MSIFWPAAGCLISAAFTVMQMVKSPLKLQQSGSTDRYQRSNHTTFGVPLQAHSPARDKSNVGLQQVGFFSFFCLPSVWHKSKSPPFSTHPSDKFR